MKTSIKGTVVAMALATLYVGSVATVAHAMEGAGKSDKEHSSNKCKGNSCSGAQKSEHKCNAPDASKQAPKN